MAEIDDRLPDDSGSQGNETIDGLDSATAARNKRHGFRRRTAWYAAENPIERQPKHALVSSIDGRDKCQTVQR